MNAADRVLLMPLGRGSDPLLEDIITSEGYEVALISSMREALEPPHAGRSNTLALLIGGSSHSSLDALLREALDSVPGVRVLIAAGNGVAPLRSPEIESRLSGKLLWIEGEVGLTRNLDRIRRFLRGEGYCWASDLGALSPNSSSILDTAVPVDQSPEKMRSIFHFAGELARFTELGPMLQEALRQYLAIMNCNAGSIYLWDDNSETLILEAAEGPEEDKRIGVRQKLGEGLAGWVAEVGEPILVTDSRKVLKLRRRVCHRYNNFSCIAVPVTHGGQLFGVVCLTMPRDNKPFDAADLRVAQALSEKMAAAIRPLSVLSELRRFSERLVGAFKSSSDMVIRKDAQVESLRAISGNILESVPMAVISYDRDLRVRSSNRMARAQFGIDVHSGPDAATAPLEDGIELDRALWRSRLLSVAESDRKFRLQRVGYQVGETRRLLDVHCSPLHDSEGATIGGILTVHDVTEDAEMEAKLSSAERLALIGKVAAKVAHELNNPLDGILRFMNLAIRQIDQPDQARAYLDDCRVGLLRMSNILTELLTFSRSHRHPSTPVGLTQVIHQALAPYERRAAECNIAIKLDVPPDLPECPGNDIWEILGNIFKNALDAMGRDGTLSIQARHEGEHVTVRIGDTGPGVPQELRERIFEPFFTTKNSGHGTGLGLALCRDALRRIGGEIRLAPSDTGAVFEVTLPRKMQTE